MKSMKKQLQEQIKSHLYVFSNGFLLALLLASKFSYLSEVGVSFHVYPLLFILSKLLLNPTF